MYVRIAVCDDDRAQREYLSWLVENWGAGCDHTLTITEFPSAESLLFDLAEKERPDILLLDIKMGQMNGVELARTLRKEDNRVQIVFVTGYPDFIAEGYDVAALHYLLKPVSAEKIAEVLDRAVENLARAECRLEIRHDRVTEYVPLSRITHIEAQRQYVQISTEDKTWRMKGSLSELEEQLDEYFYRVQRSYLVNLRHVMRIAPDHVLLRNGVCVPIARGSADEIGRAIIRLF